MNILIFSWRDPNHPNNGGAEQVTHQHAKAWIKAGHTVTLFTSMYSYAMWEEDMDGVHIVRRGGELLTVQINAFFWYRKHKKFFDLVFDHFHGIPFFTPLFVKQKKVAFIHEVARDVWKVNALPKYISWFPALVGPTIEEWIFKLLYRKIPFITVSESTKKDLIALGVPDNKITVIENGITLPKRIPKQKKEKVPTIMFLGAFAEDKGIHDCVKVFGELEKSKKRKYMYWIVGRGSQLQTDELTSFAKSLGITKNLKFWGYVSQDKKFELLSRAHVLINPSIHEGWGLVNIEANVCGTPVVSYDVHGNRDSIKNGKTGTLVPLKDTKKMAEEVQKLLNNPKQYKTMQKAGVKWSNQFTWEKSTKKSVEYIENLRKADSGSSPE